MSTKYDEKFMYLRFEYGLSRPQMNDLINRVVEENEEALVNSKDRDNLLYDLVVGELSGSTKESSIPNSTETTKDQDTNSNRKEHDIIVVTHPDVIKANGNKEFATYGAAKCISHFEGTTIEEWNNYILKRGCKKAIIDFLEDSKKSFPDGKVSNEKRIQRDFKKLIESDVPVVRVEEFNGKKYYKLLNCVMVNSKPNYFVRIPLQQMRELVVISNGNMLRLYALVCSILQAKGCGYDKYHPITRKYLAKCLGYSTNSNRCLDEIGTMLTALCKLGHLERLETTEISKDGNTYKTIHSYRRTTLEEWQEANKRGTIKK